MKTPERVAKSLAWLTRGYGLDVQTVVGDALFEEAHENMVMVRDIELYSLCEHHLLPFFGKAHVAYIPNGADRRAVQAAAHRRRVRAAAPGAGAAHRADRAGARGRAQAARRRRRHRGVPPLHDDARRREAELEDDHERAARQLPRRREDARRVPAAGARFISRAELSRAAEARRRQRGTDVERSRVRSSQCAALLPRPC